MTPEQQTNFRFHEAHEAEANLLATVRNLDAAGMTDASAKVMAIFEALRSERIEAERKEHNTA